MRRVSIRVRPSFLPVQQGRRVREPLGYHEALKRGQPMMVIARSIIRFTPCGGDLEFIGQRGGPLSPGKMSLRGQSDGEGKSGCLPRLRKYRPAGISRQLGQRLNSL